MSRTAGWLNIPRPAGTGWLYVLGWAHSPPRSLSRPFNPTHSRRPWLISSWDQQAFIGSGISWTLAVLCFTFWFGASCRHNIGSFFNFSHQLDTDTVTHTIRPKTFFTTCLKSMKCTRPHLKTTTKLVNLKQKLHRKAEDHTVKSPPTRVNYILETDGGCQKCNVAFK